ncbi:MAG: ABC transporter permease subunit [Leeuwenhoekiella sp.]|nr:ABC transporter permease subunit [Leeuwenhoekiella sp.]
MKILEQPLLKNKSRAIGLLLFVAVGVIPFAAAFIYALLYSFGVVGAMSTGFTTRFWLTVFETGTFFKSLGYSATIAALSVFLSVVIALWLTLKFKNALENRFVLMMVYMPLAIPGLVTAFFIIQLLAKGGFFARISYAAGWIDQSNEFPDLVNDNLAFGIILAFLTMIIPFFILLFLNVYKNERVEELSVLAFSLGASARQVRNKVVLPILLKKTRILITLYFVFLLGSYEVPLILGQESPQMLSVLVIRELKQYDLDKIPEGYVVAVMYTVIVAIAAIFLFLPRKKEQYV